SAANKRGVKRQMEGKSTEAKAQKRPRSTTDEAPSMLEKFHAERERNNEKQLDLRYKELACMQLVREERKLSVAPSSRYQYDRYQALFSNWCTKVGYPDNNVLEPKILRFFTCLMASEDQPSK
ncbi:hypothetical protein BGZ73_001073, partial [Actinomortierella ambigua]